MNDDERPGSGSRRAAGPDPIITHDDGDVIELPAPGGLVSEVGQGRYDDDGLLAQQTPGLDPEATRRQAGPDWAADVQGDLEAERDPGAEQDLGTERDLGAEPTGRSAGLSVADATGGDTGTQRRREDPERQRRRDDPAEGRRDIGGRGADTEGRNAQGGPSRSVMGSGDPLDPETKSAFSEAEKFRTSSSGSNAQPRDAGQGGKGRR